MKNRSMFEKAWYESKKFLSFLFMEVLLGLVLVYIVSKQGEYEINPYFALIVISLASIMGFISIAFNLSQAKLDSYIRMSAIMKGKEEGQNGDDEKPL